MAHERRPPPPIVRQGLVRPPPASNFFARRTIPFPSPGRQTTSLVNGLFLADSFGQIAQTEFKAFFWWNWCNGPYAGRDTTNNNSATLYGWRNYGNYGMLSRDRYPRFTRSSSSNR